MPELDPKKPHPMYEGETWGVDPNEKLFIEDELGGAPIKTPIRFKVVKPSDNEGKPRDQTNDAAEHMKYAATLDIPVLQQAVRPRIGKAVILGGAPSLKDQIEAIKTLAADPDNMLFTINWTHTWLIQQGVVPQACVFFEIDAEPDSTLKAAHPGVTYYICSHCHPKTFDELKNFKRVLWHSPPNSEGERLVGEEYFKDSALVGGGIGTFTRTLTVALYLGYRSFEIFGVDSSFPDDAASTHVDGYETTAKPEIDGFYVYAKEYRNGKVRRFKTYGPLALQVEEFKEYCRVNHHVFGLRVHGDSLLRYVHENMYPDQYGHE